MNGGNGILGPGARGIEALDTSRSPRITKLAHCELATGAFLILFFCDDTTPLRADLGFFCISCALAERRVSWILPYLSGTTWVS